MRDLGAGPGSFQTRDRTPQDPAKLARESWRAGEAAIETGDLTEALRWLDRAHRYAPADGNLAFSLALTHMRIGNLQAALDLFAPLADIYGGREAWEAVAHCALGLHDLERARTALSHLFGAYAVHAGTETLHARFIAAGGKAIAVTRIGVAALHATEGFVAAEDGRLLGWAWHPAAPDTDAALRVLDGAGHQIVALCATDLSVRVRGMQPLARPRGFALGGLPGGLLRVVARDGKDLTGSPLSSTLTPSAKPVRIVRRQAPQAGPVCIVIPVHGGGDTVLACIGSVCASQRPGDRLVVVNDASPDLALIAALQHRPGITLIPSCPESPARNLGFPGAANAGMRHADGEDVVLLNSDTLVFPGWIQALQDASRAAPDIGTATPLSNDASIFSYPGVIGRNPMPSAADGARLAALAAAANPGVIVNVPTAHGFCMFIRADCLAATGWFREDVFAQGYGEENDFCERAREAGFRHVAVPGVFVAHVGGASFGAARTHLLARNQALLARLHPRYMRRVSAFMRADPLRPSRARLDAARFAAACGACDAVLMVTHGAGGGTARVVRERQAACRAQGKKPIQLSGTDGVTHIEAEGAEFPNLAFTLPAALPDLVALLRKVRPVAMELHSLLGHDHSITTLAAQFAIPTDIWLHDYAWLCPRVTFTTPEANFCGEAEPEICLGCVARGGSFIDEPIPADLLRQRSAALFLAARNVIVADGESAARLRRHMPGLMPVVQPWEDDSAWPKRRAARRRRRLTVAIIGAIGAQKGYEVVLACARDAAARDLPLAFTIIGYSIDDAPLLATGRVFITGEFNAGESAALIREQHADFAFLPSVWPETWCFALSDAWRAGLDAAVFDIGAPAARVRRTGRGWVLPLGLPPARLNDALLNLQPLVDTPVSERPDGAYVSPI